MTPEQLVAEAREAGKNARHNLMWMQEHPDRYDESKRADMEQHLRNMIRFSEEEMKHARAGARTQLRSRLKQLITLILSHREVKRNA